MAFGLKSYFSPTPKMLRVLGDSLASASVFVSTYAVLNDMKVFAVGVLVSGWVGKFITNFFSDSVKEEEQNVSQ